MQNKKLIHLSTFIIVLLLSACSNKNRILAYRTEGINSLQNQNYQEALDYFNMAIKAGDVSKLII